MPGRDWLPYTHEKVLSLLLANQFGFIIKSEFDIEVEWDGTDSSESLRLFYDPNEEGIVSRVESFFGLGTFTFFFPFTLTTPKGTNLYITQPANFLSPFITVLTDIIESDFFINDLSVTLRLDAPNMRVRIPKGTPLATILPIPRHFVDSFTLTYTDKENT